MITNEPFEHVELPAAPPQPHRNIWLFIISLLALCVLPFLLLWYFLTTAGGFEMFLLGPKVIYTTFGIVIGAVILFSIRKRKVSIKTVFSILAVLLLSLISLRLNIPIMTDGQPIYWFPVMFLSQDVWGLASPVFTYLILATLAYLAVALIYVIFRSIKDYGLSLIAAIVIPLVSLVIVATHIGIIFINVPKIGSETQRKELETTFIERQPSAIVALGGSTTCSNALAIKDRLAQEGIDTSSYSVDCEDRIANDQYEFMPLPFSVSTSSRAYLTLNRSDDSYVLIGNRIIPALNYKKGDIIAVTIHLPAGDYFDLNAWGNIVSPYASSGIFNSDRSSKTIGDMTYMQRSESVQSTSHDTTLTALYPINTDIDLHKLEMLIYMSQGKSEPQILEVARIRGPYTDPDWLKQSLAAPNPFASMSVNLSVNGSHDAKTVAYGSTATLSWNSSSDIKKCSLSTEFIDATKGHYPIDNFENLLPSGQKSVTVVNKYGYQAKYHAYVICDGSAQYSGNAMDEVFLSVENVTSTSNQSAVSQRPIPYIGSIYPSTAKYGDTVTITGSGLGGFEGDVYFFFVRQDGKSIRLPAILSEQLTGEAKGAQTVKITLKESCRQGQTVYGDYSGKPSVCDYVPFEPGTYSVYTKPWDTKSNVIQFTLVQ